MGAGGILIDGSVPDRGSRGSSSPARCWWAAPTLVLAAMGARRIDVTWYGKAGTFGLMFAFPLFLASHSDLSWADTAGVLAWVAGIPGLVLSLYSAVLYVPLARRALAEGRADRAATASADSTPRVPSGHARVSG